MKKGKGKEKEREALILEAMETIRIANEENTKVEEEDIDLTKLTQVGKGKFGIVYQLNEDTVVKSLGRMNDQIAKEITIHKIVNNENIIPYKGEFKGPDGNVYIKLEKMDRTLEA